MVVFVFDRYGAIAERLVSLINDSVKNISSHYCTNLEQGLQLLQHSTPDIVLMDMKFPGNRTQELIKKIKEANNKAIIVCLFIVPDSLLQEESLKNGADYAMDKYMEFEKIPGLVAQIVNKKLIRH